MKVKLNEDGSIAFEEKDGEKYPVWVGEDGKEVAFNVPAAETKIHELLANEGRSKKQLKQLETTAKQYEGIDIEAAKQALEKVKTLKDGDYIESTVIDEMKRNFQDTLASKELTLQEAIDLRDKQLSTLLISNQFASSKRLQQKTVIPPKMMESYFGQYCTVKTDNKGNPYTSVEYNGNPIYSRDTPGELAGFDEAIEYIIDKDSDKESYLRSPETSGSGATNHQKQTSSKPANDTSLSRIEAGLVNRQNGT